MESKELIQSYLHAKAWSFIYSRLENLWGGGSEWPPPLGLVCYSKKLGRPRVNTMSLVGCRFHIVAQEPSDKLQNIDPLEVAIDAQKAYL